MSDAATGGEAAAPTPSIEGTTALTGGAPIEQQSEGTTQVDSPKTEAESAPGTEGTEAPDGAPESYEDFEIPEGAELDATVVESAKSLAKDLGLSQANAQRVADLLAGQALAQTKAMTEGVQRVHSEWAAELKADSEVGGDKLPENLAAAKAAMLATTTPQMQMLLERTGLGNNVEVVRHFLRIAPAFAESRHVPGSAPPSSGQKSAAQVLYGKQS